MDDERLKEFGDRFDRGQKWLDLLCQGRALITRGEFAEAIPVLSEARALDAAIIMHVECAERLAYALHQIGRVNEAEPLYREVLLTCLRGVAEERESSLPAEVHELVRADIDRIEKYGKKSRAKFAHQIIKNCSDNYGKLLQDQERMRDAESLQEQIHVIELALESVLQELNS